jgi:hypothetical protein
MLHSGRHNSRRAQQGDPSRGVEAAHDRSVFKSLLRLRALARRLPAVLLSALCLEAARCGLRGGHQGKDQARTAAWQVTARQPSVSPPICKLPDRRRCVFIRYTGQREGEGAPTSRRGAAMMIRPNATPPRRNLPSWSREIARIFGSLLVLMLGAGTILFGAYMLQQSAY